MRAATGRTIVKPLLGPFVVHDVFLFNSEPIIVHDLVLRKHNDYVGLETLAEIRAGEDSDAEMDLIPERLHWRALRHVNISPDGGNDLLPRLSQRGRQLVEAFAGVQEMELEASVELVIQGSTGQYRLGRSRTIFRSHTPPSGSLTLKSDRLQCYPAFSDHLLTPSRWEPSKVSSPKPAGSNIT